MVGRRAAVLGVAGVALLAAVAGAQDTTMVQGGIYQRPFLVSEGRTAVGGYAEGGASWFRTDGVGGGPGLELRRFNIFLFSSVGRRLRFISELEFEHGTEEIALETALVDFTITPSLILRGGIILPPVGAFNVNHDAPRYDFVDRPLVSTEIIPATLSEAGIGVHGRLAPRGFSLSYDAYLTNGLGEGVILNDRGRTHLASGKAEARFAEDNNGSPAVSARIGAQRRDLGEVGVSVYGGVYNRHRIEGMAVDEPRWLSLVALDLATTIGALDLRGEAARAVVSLPADLREFQGGVQWGFHLDAVLPVWRPAIAALDDPVVSLGLRLERVDYNVGGFSSTGRSIGDETGALTVSASLRPVPGTVFRLNYRRESHRDLQGNPAVATAGFQLGFATYF